MHPAVLLSALPGRRYKWYPIPIDAAYERSSTDAKLSVQLMVAQLNCGEAMSCRVVGQWTQPDGTTANEPLFDWTSTGCWFQYWHFTNTGNLWSCRDDNAGEYVLQCVDCGPQGSNTSQGTQPEANGGGPGRGSSINPSVIIVSGGVWLGGRKVAGLIATCVCSGTAVLVGLALLIRHRRRTRSMNMRIAELLRRAETGNGRGRHSPLPPDFKPPPLYKLELPEPAAGAAAEGAHEAGAGGGGGEGQPGEEVPREALPPERLPAPGYKGPIVVINYDGCADWDSSLQRGSVVLAVSELSGGTAEEDGAAAAAAALRRHRRSHRHRRRRQLVPPTTPEGPAHAGSDGAAGGTGADGARSGASGVAGAGAGGSRRAVPGPVGAQLASGERPSNRGSARSREAAGLRAPGAGEGSSGASSGRSSPGGGLPRGDSSARLSSSSPDTTPRLRTAGPAASTGGDGSGNGGGQRRRTAWEALLRFPGAPMSFLRSPDGGAASSSPRASDAAAASLPRPGPPQQRQAWPVQVTEMQVISASRTGGSRRSRAQHSVAAPGGDQPVTLGDGEQASSKPGGEQQDVAMGVVAAEEAASSSGTSSRSSTTSVGGKEGDK
ncbi:hypothetical protein N2152v2_001823 [Parachlorella kessleri]